MAAVCTTFVPLKTISPDAVAVQGALYKSIEAGISANKYPKGLKKQYEIQLEHIKNAEPSCELIGFPGLLSFPSTWLMSHHELITNCMDMLRPPGA